jgi:death-on-curing protein
VNEEPRWIGRLVVEAVHFDTIRTFGGMHGLRDEDALESALARPRQKWSYGDEPDLAALGASYAFGLVRNHPFHDGNKRMGFLAAAVFLGINGAEIEAPEAEVVTAMLGLAAGDVSEEEFAEWLRGHLVTTGEGPE